MPLPPAFPSPETTHPIVFPDGTRHPGTVYLNAIFDLPGLSVGDYTYYSDHEMPPPDTLRLRLFPYLYGAQQIEIGAYCCIAQGVQFVTASANHRYDGFSTYPFAIFDGMDPGRPSMPGRTPEPTRVGNDCWLGHGAIILPGAQLGHGVIVGAGAVVGGVVPDYSIVTGNPGRVLRRRFDEATIARLLELAWWEWPIEHILAHEAEICGADLAALEAAAP